MAHVAGHAHVAEDATREQTLTDRATAAMPTFRAMSHIAAGKLVTPNDALKTFALRRPDHVHELTGLKFLHRELVANVGRDRISRPVFADKCRHGGVRLFAVPDHRLGGILLLLRAESELNGVIAVGPRR